MRSSKRIFGFPIALKFVLATGALLAICISSLVIGARHSIVQYLNTAEDKKNASQVTLIAIEVEEVIANVIDKSRNGIVDDGAVAIEIFERGEKKAKQRAVNVNYLKMYALQPNIIDLVRQQVPLPLEGAFEGETEIINSSILGGAPLFTVVVPHEQVEAQVKSVAAIDVRLDHLQTLFSVASKDGATFYLVDREGKIIAHPDDHLVTSRANLSQVPFVGEALQNASLEARSKSFVDPVTGSLFRGAFAKTKYGVTVIAQVPESLVLTPSTKTQNFLLGIGGCAISIGLFLAVLFSLHFSRPLEVFKSVAEEILVGNSRARNSVNRSDEFGETSQAFDSMIDSIAKRERLRDVLNKFRSNDLRAKLLDGSLNLDANQKQVTALLIEVKRSENNLEEFSAQQTLNRLNDYFDFVADIVSRNNGVIDKFFGDAVLAVWGIPEGPDSDPAKAVMAALEIRFRLKEWSAGKNTPSFHLGMGIHTGTALTGRLGSEGRQEYSVSGPVINQLSQIEDSTKYYSQDLLISESTADLVKDQFTVEEVGSLPPDGERKATKIFKVLGFVGEENRRKRVLI